MLSTFTINTLSKTQTTEQRRHTHTKSKAAAFHMKNQSFILLKCHFCDSSPFAVCVECRAFAHLSRSSHDIPPRQRSQGALTQFSVALCAFLLFAFHFSIQLQCFGILLLLFSYLHCELEFAYTYAAYHTHKMNFHIS